MKKGEKIEENERKIMKAIIKKRWKKKKRKKMENTTL